jgi:hypothetical protein
MNDYVEPRPPNNPWAYWQNRQDGIPVQMHPDDPQAGFYRLPRKDYYGARKTFMPVAYYPKDGTLHCRFGDGELTPQAALELWTHVGDHDVSEEAYRAVAERGEPWPDEHELVPMGDNVPPDDSSFEGLTDAIEDLAREALARIEGPKIADQDEADRIANLADRLAELWNKAEAARKQERREHDEALKAIQLKWTPLLLKAERYKDLKYKLLTPWLLALQKAQQQEAEAAAAAGAPAAADARRPRAGTRGRAQTLKGQKRAEIIDYDACLAFFKDSEDLRGTVQMLANRAVRAGANVPGTKIIEDQKAV